jgi:hypothetical protein
MLSHILENPLLLKNPRAKLLNFVIPAQAGSQLSTSASAKKVDTRLRGNFGGITCNFERGIFTASGAI